MKTQTARVLSLLQAGGSITPIAALRMFGCLRLAPRIHELRERGYDIVTIHDPGVRYARYVLQRKRAA